MDLSWLFPWLRPAPVPTPDPLAGDVPTQLLALHNQARARIGLPALRWNGRLEAAAQRHAARMAELGILSHIGIGDGGPADRVKDAGYTWGAMAENIAWNESTPADVVADWLRSPAHRANILGRYVEIGGAVATGHYGPYWCVVFGTPA
jgi:uncharacterized protein YkwD